MIRSARYGQMRIVLSSSPIISASSLVPLSGCAVSVSAAALVSISSEISCMKLSYSRLTRRRLGADRQDIKNKAAKLELAIKVREYEKQGMTHLQALGKAEHQINLAVTINGDEAHAEEEGKTRTPAVMVRRGKGGGD